MGDQIIISRWKHYMLHAAYLLSIHVFVFVHNILK